MHFLPTSEASGSSFPIMRTAPPILLTIAGFDPSSGAGITADLKVFAAHGLFGVSCATALTVQSTRGVRRSQAVEGAFVEETLAYLGEDFPIAGVKIGMLADAEVVHAVARWVAAYRRKAPQAPIVLDPVLRSSSGADLLAPAAVAVLEQDLLPLVSVITPNLAEASRLANWEAATRDAVPALAAALRRRLGHGPAVVITGGHLDNGVPDDYLAQDGEEGGRWIPGRWVETRSTHGTGCAFSSALLCGLVQGFTLHEATTRAKAYVEAALAAAYPLGSGRGPMHHLYAADAILAPAAEARERAEASD